MPAAILSRYRQHAMFDVAVNCVIVANVAYIIAETIMSEDPERIIRVRKA